MCLQVNTHMYIIMTEIGVRFAQVSKIAVFTETNNT